VAASRTAQYVAVYRALETHEFRRAPLFHDPFAERFLSSRLLWLVRAARRPLLRSVIERYADVRAPGSRTSAIARTAYIDDAVRAARASGVDQFVILGAGFDCRAHRMPELEGARVFELDRVETQAVKRARLPASGVRYVAIDFLRDDAGAALEAAGWDRARRSLFVWEGVTNYLTERAVVGTLAWIAGAGPGTRLVFTYVHAGLLDGSIAFDAGAQLIENVRRLGEPWTFGLHPDAVKPFLARAGLRLREDLGADDYRRRYLGAAAMPGYRFYRVATADVAAGAG